MNEYPYANLSIKNLIKDNFVIFEYYQSGNLYYRTTVEVDGKHYIFPVPIEDTGDGKFLRDDKAILFMRYIRKAIQDELLQECKV